MNPLESTPRKAPDPDAPDSVAPDDQVVFRLASEFDASSAGDSPSLDHRSPEQRKRWRQMRGALLMLDRFRPSRVTDTPAPADREAQTLIVSATPLGAGKLFGRFRLIRELGRGGMGVVHEAWDDKLARRIALKALDPNVAADSARRARFVSEGHQLLARLQHPNIVQVFETGEFDEQLYLAMEFVDGPNLQQILDHRPLTASRATSLVDTLVRAVAHAHAAGVLHRDLKPSNEAITYFELSASQAKALAEEFPDNAIYRRDWAMSITNSAILRSFLRRPAEAEERFRESLEIRMTLHHGKLDNVFTADQYIANGERDLATILIETGKLNAAAEHVAVARTYYPKLLAVTPNSPKLQEELAIIDLSEARILAAKGDHAAAEKHFRSADAAFGKLVARLPSVITFKQYQAAALRYYADSLTALDRTDEAKECLARAAALKKQWNTPTKQSRHPP